MVSKSKWFNEDKNKRSYIVFEGEAPPTRSRRSKDFIPKTMFLAAVARPRIWDGKLGIWAFTEEYVAQRRSKYRTKGTLCVRNIESVTRDVYKEYLLTFLIPSIKAKWPAKDRSRPILIQQDNAKPHVSPFDPEIVAAGSVDGWFIRLIVQPPNSPDYNALDLGLFASIQSIQYRYAIRGINNLIDVVEAAYEELSTTTQDNVFLTLQACMLCVLEADGGNDYKIPHQSKEKLRRAGLLPRVLTCDRALYERSCQLLRDAGRSWFPGMSGALCLQLCAPPPLTSRNSVRRKLEDTHGEIAQVREEVVEALRAFYASSSAISADEAVRIAATWGASHAFPVAGDDADASDLQEKMRRLNVALLDAVDRLQLDESGEMAPEAQLMLSLTQRERLKKQVQQSKTMLALIEQLTEMDRLLGEVDEAIDQQRFVAAAEGVAEVERLVQELVEAEDGDGHDAEDKKIIKVVKLQLLRKKNRLIIQLTRYFACTAVWKDGTLKVTEGLAENEFEATKLSLQERRRDFWKACEVLDLLTPKLKEIAKAVSQQLIKPMLQMPQSNVEQTKDGSGATLKIVARVANGDTASSTESEAVEVQNKCANAVRVLQFVHAELFAGNAELMNQLGDFMWKIPGNLEAQLMNLLQDKIPQDAAALDAYRDALLTTVVLEICIHDCAVSANWCVICGFRQVGSFENTLVAIGFSACSNSQLRGFVDQLRQYVGCLPFCRGTLVNHGIRVACRLHSKKRRQVILSNGRDLMHKGYHDSVKITGSTEKCSLNSVGSGKKGKSGGEGITGSGVSAGISGTDDVESSCFQVPDYRVTVCAHKLVELAHETLVEACTAALDAEKDLERVGSFLKRSLYKLNGISSSWHEGLPTPVYNKVMSRMLEPLVKNFVDSVLSQTVGASVECVCLLNVFTKCAVAVVKKISENTGVQLHHLLSMLLEVSATAGLGPSAASFILMLNVSPMQSENLFASPTQAVKCVPSIARLTKLTAILVRTRLWETCFVCFFVLILTVSVPQMDPLATVRDNFNSGDLSAFSTKEIAVLVRYVEAIHYFAFVVNVVLISNVDVECYA
ncbi:unnamed protein product [Phytophthora lilii]|uniref:Unnamed protein product n=1 Tax=Phytophthora lilii TaxID=2077276 RepID=A0A9W7CNX8_9STRA|nr:unnamed protein product [Phytophthora lilii]